MSAAKPSTDAPAKPETGLSSSTAMTAGFVEQGLSESSWRQVQAVAEDTEKWLHRSTGHRFFAAWCVGMYVVLELFTKGVPPAMGTGMTILTGVFAGAVATVAWSWARSRRKENARRQLHRELEALPMLPDRRAALADRILQAAERREVRALAWNEADPT